MDLSIDDLERIVSEKKRRLQLIQESLLRSTLLKVAKIIDP